MELPTSPKRCLAIAMLRAILINQKDTAGYTRCANQTVVDTERWLREEDYHNVARICDDQSIKKMVTTEAIYWGLKEEDLVRLDRLTQDDVLRHYRTDYLKRADLSDPRFLKHTADVLRLLDTYASQLAVTWEPEDFVTPSEPPNEKEFDYWFYAKKVVPSLETLIDSQIDSESLTLAPELEREPEFEALTGHYEGIKLWEQMASYKQKGGEYVSIGAKLYRTIVRLIDSVFADKTEAHTFRSALAELIREDLAPVRAKLHLEGIETDKTAVLRSVPSKDRTSLLQGTELLQRYLNDRSAIEAQEAQKLFAELQNLLARITEAYQRLKVKQRDILRGLKEEKFKGQLPAGSKCKFCPST
ncbi:MAG: hypothetical protein HWN68_13710 [Desulfobacterales bacterium]|nr:hypothetical protein [Desulfobacterales bacterium]